MTLQSTLRMVTAAAPLVLALFLLGLGAPAEVRGQGSRDKGQAQQAEEPTREQMMQMMGQMSQVMMEGSLTVLAKPETAERFAAFTKHYYDALVAKGFSKEDALKIVTTHGIPTLPGGR